MSHNLQQTKTPTKSSPRRAFAFIEVVVVVLIMGVIAAAAVPHVFEDHVEERARSTRQSLAILRNAIDVCKARTGSFPETTDSESFAASVEKYLNGPFPAPTIPPGRNTHVIFIAADGTQSGGNPDGSTGIPGWTFRPATGELRVNSSEIESTW
ncbi:MAG: prepilin-type N-terminal cleavage/methylation domain-containing protein [Planctomycetota bacterium]